MEISKENGLATVQSGAFCQFTFQWIHSYESNKSTGLETGKLHLFAVNNLDFFK